MDSRWNRKLRHPGSVAGRNFDPDSSSFLVGYKPDRQESGYNLHVGASVAIQPRRREHSSAGQSERQQQLVSQMLSRCGAGNQVRSRFLNGLRRDTFGACSEPAESAKLLRDARARCEFNQHNISGADGVLGFDNFHGFLFPIQQACYAIQLALRNRARQIRDDCCGFPVRDVAAFRQVNRRQLRARFNYRGETSTPCRVEPMSLEVDRYLWTQPADDRQETLLQKVKRRRRQIVRATFDRYAARCCRGHQSRQNRLQHQGAAAGCTDHETMLSWPDGPWNKCERARPQARAFDFGSPDFRGCENRRKVLPQQPGAFALSTDVLDAESLSGCERKAQRRAQDLPASFSRRSVNPNHAYAPFASNHPFTHTT